MPKKVVDIIKKQYKEPEENLPAVITTENYEKKCEGEVVLFLKNKCLEENNDGKGDESLSFISEFHRIYDASHYVLFFPSGQNSFGFYPPKKNGESKNFDIVPPNKERKKRKINESEKSVKAGEKKKVNKDYVTCRE